MTHPIDEEGKALELESGRRLFGEDYEPPTYTCGCGASVGAEGDVCGRCCLTRDAQAPRARWSPEHPSPGPDDATMTRIIVRYTLWRHEVFGMLRVEPTEPSIEYKDEDGQITDAQLQRLLGVRLGLTKDDEGRWAPARAYPQRPCTGGPRGEFCGQPSIVVARDQAGLEWFSCPLHTEGRRVEYLGHWLRQHGLGDPAGDVASLELRPLLGRAKDGGN